MSEMERWWIDLLANGLVGFITLAALIVAIVQVRHARSEASAARAAVARERRVTFELQLLAEIYDQFGVTGTAHLAGRVNALIRDCSSDELRLLRAVTGAKVPSNAAEMLVTFPRSSPRFEGEIRRELDRAIEERLREEEI